MSYFYKHHQMREVAKGWGKEINAAWDEVDHPRGKTTEASNSGSFAPKEGGGSQKMTLEQYAAERVAQARASGEPVPGVDYPMPKDPRWSTPEEAAAYRAAAEHKQGGAKAPPLGAGVKGTSYKVRDKVEVGAILYTSWGYDQTNTEFYEVTGASKSGKTVTIRELAADSIEDGFMSGYKRPVLGQYAGHPMTKKVLAGEKLKIHGNYGYGHLWDGTDKAVSWGH